MKRERQQSKVMHRPLGSVDRVEREVSEEQRDDSAGQRRIRTIFEWPSGAPRRAAFPRRWRHDLRGQDRRAGLLHRARRCREYRGDRAPLGQQYSLAQWTWMAVGRPAHRLPFIGASSGFQELVGDIVANDAFVSPAQISRVVHDLSPVPFTNDGDSQDTAFLRFVTPRDGVAAFWIAGGYLHQRDAPPSLYFGEE